MTLRNTRSLHSRKAFVLLLPLLALGCYVPELADPVSLARGEDIRLVLTPTGRAQLEEITPRGGREVAGQLVEANADSLTLTARLSSPSSVPGAASSLRQTMTFARIDIQQVTVPQFHTGRTAAVVAGALAIAGLLLADVFDFRGSSPPGDPGPRSPAPFWARPH